MPDTYTDAATSLNWIREILGDTLVGVAWSSTRLDGHMFSDTRIQNLIDSVGAAPAAASLAESKAARYATLAGKWSDADASEDITKSIEYFQDLAKRIRSGQLVPPGEDAAGGFAVQALELPDLSEYRTD
ncbi:MAG: hypothetical protein K1X67_08055 [Fimbriimonadaceae bacterium]|nr:hypothetical protein [Fimbriimonadaceae bacterium]